MRFSLLLKKKIFVEDFGYELFQICLITLWATLRSLSWQCAELFGENDLFLILIFQP